MLQKEADCIALPKEKNAICHVQAPARSQRMNRCMPSTELRIHNKQCGCRHMHPTHCFQLEFIHSKSTLWTHTNYGYRRSLIPTRTMNIRTLNPHKLWVSKGVNTYPDYEHPRCESTTIEVRDSEGEYPWSNLRPEEKVQVLPSSTWRCTK